MRFAKKRQMRCSDEGAHLLVQDRVTVLNGALRPRATPTLLRAPKPEPDPRVVRTYSGKQRSPHFGALPFTLRNFMDGVRGSGVDTGGPPPISHADRQAFANQLDRLLVRLGKSA